jgi:DHA3 family tetracycline resistance protein-like MFS transporter
MLHSHEALDRAGGTARGGLLTPLRFRDFRLLWSGACISLLGDGAFLVALAWAVYELSNVPTAMSLVGIAMTVPTIVFLLVGGVASDRLDRRRIMLAADVARAAAVGTLAVLSLTGALELWHVVVLVVFYGTGAAFFAPAFDAIVPELVPGAHLAQANALEQIVRPLAMRLAGPALGGLLVGTFGSGTAFALDAASFLVSAAALLAMRRGARKPVPAGVSVLGDLRDGWRYVRSRTWLWATFASAAVAYLCFMGPVEVLLPLIVKQELGGSATDLGIVFAAGGLGSVGCALLIGRRGLPRRDITFMYAAWTLATLAVAGYGVAGAVWQLMLASLAFNALETAGTIVWATAKQRHVPGDMLGRVSSLDWLISIGLLPLSFALTGPVSAAIGAQGTLIAAGTVGAVVTLSALFLPGMRAVEGRPPLREADLGLREPSLPEPAARAAA